MRHLARAAFLLSGVAGLTFEIVWSRYLGLAMGATSLAIATVTAAYMGGLALGSHLAGRYSDRIKRPLMVYGFIEIAVGIIGLGIPYLSQQIAVVDAGLPLESGAGRAIIRFAVACALLIIPTTAMGATLPILARSVTRHIGHVGREVGLLYAINIAGGVAGAALCGFVWLPAIGHTQTNLIAVGLDVSLGVVAVIAGFLLTPQATRSVTDTYPDSNDAPLLAPGGRGLVGLLAVTGAAAMALQVLWTRAIATALGPSTYAFSVILCAYLCGLAIGGAIASRLADRTESSRFYLCLVLLGTGLFAFVGIALVDDMPLMLRSVVLDRSLTPASLMRANFFIASTSLLPATLCMGAIFPLTLGAVVGSSAKLGAAVGRAYAVNTVGAIFGSFAAVFVLLPAFGVEWGMRSAALVYVLLAAVLAFRLEPRVSDNARRDLRLAIGTVAFLSLVWPSWNIGTWTLGMYRMSLARAFFADSVPTTIPIIFHRDGFASTVTVEEQDGVRWIKIDGKIDGSSEGDMPTQILSGLLPKLAHPAARRVAVIGCGSCVTIGSILRTDIEAATLIEIEAEVINAARFFEAVNHAPWKDQRLTIVEDDGRNFLRRGDRDAAGNYAERFDIIVSEPSNPWMTGAASLFTAEFFTIAAARLASDGVFLQWLQIYELAPERVNVLLKTFHSVFAHVLVFSAHRESNDLLLLGSSAPLQFDWSQLESDFAALEEELDSADLHAPHELLALSVFSDREIDALPDVPALNTDDNALIEFGAPRDLITYAESDPKVPIVAALEGKRFELVRRSVHVPVIDWPRRALQLAQGYLVQGMLPDVAGVTAHIVTEFPDHSVADQAREIAQVALLLNEDDQEIVLDGETARRDEQYAIIARLVIQGEDGAALIGMQAVPGLTRRSPAHSLLHGYLLYSEGELDAARLALEAAAGALAADSEKMSAVTYYQAKEAFESGEYARAATKMREYGVLSKRLSVAPEGD